MIFDILEGIANILSFGNNKDDAFDKKYSRPLLFLIICAFAFFLCLYNFDLTFVKNTDLLFWLISICSMVFSFSMIYFFRKNKIINELSIGQFLIYFVGTSLLLL